VRDRRGVLAGCALTALTAASCAALLAAALFVPAPVAVLPLLVPVSIGVPLFATWELARRIATGDDAREPGVPGDAAFEARAVAELRRSLARLPETRHPLGF
jgi:hypothetical protein